MSLKLYLAPGSCSIASQIALEEAGANYERTAVLLAKGEQREPEFQAINPHGRIPVLFADEVAISETVAILTYIASRFRDADLLPFNDVLLLGRAYQRMSWYASTLHVAIAQVWRSERYSADEACWPSIQARGRELIQKGFAEIEESLGDGTWILGDRYSVLDGYTLVFYRWGERLGLDMAGYRRWHGHQQRLIERPAVARALAAEAHAADLRA